MSDLLIAVPEGWVSVPTPRELIDNAMGVDAAINAIADKAYNTLDGIFDDTNYLPVGHTVINARVFPDPEEIDGLLFWFESAPI